MGSAAEFSDRNRIPTLFVKVTILLLSGISARCVDPATLAENPIVAAWVVPTQAIEDMASMPTVHPIARIDFVGNRGTLNVIKNRAAMSNNNRSIKGRLHGRLRDIMCRGCTFHVSGSREFQS